MSGSILFLVFVAALMIAAVLFLTPLERRQRRELRERIEGRAKRPGGRPFER